MNKENLDTAACSSPPVGKRGKPFIMTYRHHLLIKQIEFFKSELNDLLNYGTLDDTAAGSAKDIQMMIEQNIAAFVNEVHERSIWLQKKKGRNGSIKELWVTRLGPNRQVTSTTKAGLYEKIYYYYKTGNPYLGNRNQHSLKYLFPRFMKDYKAYDNVTGKTLQEYQQRWNRYFEPYPITDRCIEDIRPIEWKQFFQKLIKEHNLTKSQFQDIRTVLNGVFEYAVDLEIVESNRIRDLNYRRMPYAESEAYHSVKAKAFTAEQMACLKVWCYNEIASRKKRSIYPYCILWNMNMGLRFGELAALAWEDIDFNQKVITVHSQMISEVEMVDGKFVSRGRKIVNHLKSHEKARMLPLLPESIEILKKIRELRLDDVYVFPPGHFRYKTYNDKIKEAAGAIGLSPKDFHTHCLRATAATSIYLSTKDLYLTQAMLGHTTPEMTQKYIKDWRQVEDIRKALEENRQELPAPRFTLVC